MKFVVKGILKMHWIGPGMEELWYGRHSRLCESAILKRVRGSDIRDMDQCNQKTNLSQRAMRLKWNLRLFISNLKIECKIHWFR